VLATGQDDRRCEAHVCRFQSNLLDYSSTNIYGLIQRLQCITGNMTFLFMLDVLCADRVCVLCLHLFIQPSPTSRYNHL
jgi:hypothetical protein